MRDEAGCGGSPAVRRYKLSGVGTDGGSHVPPAGWADTVLPPSPFNNLDVTMTKRRSKF